jgi:hypothetical protein
LNDPGCLAQNGIRFEFCEDDGADFESFSGLNLDLNVLI